MKSGDSTRLLETEVSFWMPVKLYMNIATLVAASQELNARVLFE